MSVVVITACGSSPPVIVSDAGSSVLNGTDVGDVIGRPALVLPDTTGSRFDLRNRPVNELTVIFFGYTHCPDLCPTTMADLAAARRSLPPSLRSQVKVVFVTEDPATDTPAVLSAWLQRFDRSFIGLIGGNRATAHALDALKAPRTEVAPRATASGQSGLHPSASHSPGHNDGSGRNVEHSGSVYAFLGERVVVYTGGTTPEQYSEDFRRLLSPG
jgi:protein SCO1/2